MSLNDACWRIFWETKQQIFTDQVGFAHGPVANKKTNSHETSALRQLNEQLYNIFFKLWKEIY